MNKTIKLFFMVAILLSCCWGADAASRAKKFKMKDQGLSRIYYFYAPENLKKDAPLVMVLHGYSDKAEDYSPEMMDLADQYGFAVCFPQGSKDVYDKNCWNVKYPWQADMKVDDAQFIRTLVGELQEKYELSHQNVFCTGMSNGGEMTYLLAYQCADLFSAVAPIGGLVFEWMYRELTPSRAVPLMEVHGTADDISYWNGDLTNSGGWGWYVSVPMAISAWAYMDRCTAVNVRSLGKLDKEGAHEVILHTYTGGTDGAEVRLYEVVGGDHSWSTESLNTEKEIWDFFCKYMK